MAIARAQTAITARNNTGAALTTGAFGSNTTAGNMIVVYCWLYSGDSTGTFPTNAVTDSKSNSYTRRQIQVDGSGGHSVCAIFESQNLASAGSAHTVTISPTGTQSALIAGAVEYSGAATSNAQDVGTLLNGSASPSPDTGPTATTAQADEVFCAACSSTAGAPATWARNQAGSAPASGWTVVATETDNSDYQAGDSVDVIATATAAAEHFWSTSPDDGNWAAVIETYKAAGGAPPPTGPKLQVVSSPLIWR